MSLGRWFVGSTKMHYSLGLKRCEMTYLPMRLEVKPNY